MKILITFDKEVKKKKKKFLIVLSDVMSIWF